MINHIYKIGIWKKDERLAEVDCKIYTDNVPKTLADLHFMDFKVKVDGEVHFTAKYIERNDIKVMHKPHIGYINKTKHNGL